MTTEGLLTAKEYKSHTALAQTTTQGGMTLLNVDAYLGSYRNLHYLHISV